MDLMRGIIFGGVCALVATFGSSGMNRDTSPMMQIFRPNIPRSDVAIIPDATTRSHKKPQDRHKPSLSQKRLSENRPS